MEKLREREVADAEEEAARQKEEADQRALKEFEKVQMGLNYKLGAGRNVVGRRDGKVVVEEEVESGEKRREKRKFEIDKDELLRIANEDRSKARKAIDDEKAAKQTLPSFWVPSVTPASNTKDELHDVRKKFKASPVCPASQADKPHAYSLHTLITINFSEEAPEGAKEKQRICPSCKKALSNSLKAMLTKPCGHVICKTCVERFMTKGEGGDPHAPKEEQEKVRCFVCEADVTEVKPKEGKAEKDKIRPGLVELRSEGTGFASGGKAKVEKEGIAFQC